MRYTNFSPNPPIRPSKLGRVLRGLLKDCKRKDEFCSSDECRNNFKMRRRKLVSKSVFFADDVALLLWPTLSILSGSKLRSFSATLLLNPNPEAMSKLITENASEEFLYSLSNYCACQGFVEDQFGLGLIARAVQEGIAVIKPTGIMIFNIGGRPGQGVCRCLFERRGFRITQLWQTKIMQAADTDISALVEIEKNSWHRFEFFMGHVGDQPIWARTAWACTESGGRISHALSVYKKKLGGGDD